MLKTKGRIILFVWLSVVTAAVALCWNNNVKTGQSLLKMQNQEEESFSSNKGLENEVRELNEKVEQYKKEVKDLGKVLYYIGKLADKDFTGTYGHGYTWYTAAEELGKIGKPAIPYLVENLKTQDDYERTVTFYALMLSSQHENVKEFTKGEYINLLAPLNFDAKQHAQMKKKVDAWWEKYKNHWE